MTTNHKWRSPNELVFLDTVSTIKALDAVRIGLCFEEHELLAVCSPYMAPLKESLDNLIDLAAISLGFSKFSRNGVVRYQKSDVITDDYVGIDKDEFVTMIYDSRNDHMMLRSIYNAIVNHDPDDTAVVFENHKKFL